VRVWREGRGGGVLGCLTAHPTVAPPPPLPPTIGSMSVAVNQTFLHSRGLGGAHETNIQSPWGWGTRSKTLATSAVA
jgi:hypothetical protein